jgi:hypothetical protein
MNDGPDPAPARVPAVRVAVVIVAMLAADGLPAAADVITLTPVRDNTLFQDVAGSLSNGAGPAIFAGRNSQNLIRRALVRFDVEGSIPSGVEISSVVLTLNVSNVSDATPRIFTLHRVLSDWGEGASSATGGNGAVAAAGDATWLHAFHPDSFWNDAGGDFEPIAGASQLLGDIGAYSWSGPNMKSDVQAWVNGVVPNHGWIIVGDETVAGTARRFDSRENTVAAHRPMLTVTYSVSTGVGEEALRGIAFSSCRPNPGPGPLRLRLALRAGARVDIMVHDVRGRHVGTVMNRELGPGVHELEWNAKGLDGRPVPNGVYFVGLSVDGRKVTARRWVRLQ